MFDQRLRERIGETHGERPAEECPRSPERQAMIQRLIQQHAAYLRQPRQVYWSYRENLSKIPVVIHGKWYPSAGVASRVLGFSKQTISRWCFDGRKGFGWGKEQMK